jgi:hypothetical protein
MTIFLNCFLSNYYKKLFIRDFLMNINTPSAYEHVVQISEIQSLKDQSSSSNCIITNSMEDISNYLNNVNTKTLIIFDIDNTIRMSNEPSLQMGVVSRKENWEVVRNSFKEMSEVENAAFRALYTLRQGTLVDPIIPTMIKNLQNRGVKVIALTAAFAGYIDDQWMPEYRYQELLNWDIDFSKSFKDIEKIEFEKLEPFLGFYPVYYKGIISTNTEKNSKYSLTQALLEMFDCEGIVVIEDIAANADGCAKAANEMGKKCQTFCYTGAQNYPKEDISNNEFLTVWIELVNQAKKISTTLSQK